MYYNYKIEFPFSKLNLNYKEITTKDQLYLAKSRLSFNENIGYFEFIKKIFKNNIEFPLDLEKIDLIEFLMFIIKNRILCSGNIIEIKTEKENQTANIKIDLNLLLKSIYNSFDKKLLYIDTEKFKIDLGFPYIKDYNYILNMNKNTLNVINTFYLFVKKINGINMFDLTLEQKQKLFNNLPLSITEKIKNNILTILDNMNHYDYFNIDFFKNFKINIYNESYLEMIKFLSLYDIESIHREIYILSNMNPDYLMNISPIERKMYLNFFVQEKEAKAKSGSGFE
jgi:hypothetical protein